MILSLSVVTGLHHLGSDVWPGCLADSGFCCILSRRKMALEMWEQFYSAFY
jgi:hypothetical protein